MPQGNPKNGELYRHFKNNLYQVLHVAKHTETGEKLVIYQALYGDFLVYARPYDMFISPVDRVKYPDASQTYRFELVEREEEEMQSMPSESLFMAFLDDDSMDEKYKILLRMKEELEMDDFLIDNLAASLDLVIEEGNIDKRYEELKNCIRIRSRFETSRFGR